MEEETKKPQPQPLSKSELERIRQTSINRDSEKAVGQGSTSWQETFQLYSDVPLLLDEIDRLRQSNGQLLTMCTKLMKERADILISLGLIPSKEKGGEVQPPPPSS